MVVRVQWDDPDETVLRMEFSDSWTWGDFLAAVDIEWDWMEQVDHRVDVIVDMQALDGLPRDALAQIHYIAPHLHSNRGLLVLAGAAAVTQGYADILGQRRPHIGEDIILAPSLDSARAVLSRLYKFRQESA